MLDAVVVVVVVVVVIVVVVVVVVTEMMLLEFGCHTLHWRRNIGRIGGGWDTYVVGRRSYLGEGSWTVLGLGRMAGTGRNGLDVGRYIVGIVGGYFGVGADENVECGRTVGGGDIDVGRIGQVTGRLVGRLVTGILGRILCVRWGSTGRDNICRIEKFAIFEIEVTRRFAWTTWFLLSLLLLGVEVTLAKATWLLWRIFLVGRSSGRRGRCTRKGKRIQRRRRHGTATYIVIDRSDLPLLDLGERLRGSVLQIVAAVGTADDQIELLDDELG